MLAGLETPRDHLWVGLVDGEVHHGVDLGIREHGVERAMDATAKTPGVGPGAGFIEVERADRTHRGMVGQLFAISGRDVAAADDRHAQRPAFAEHDGAPFRQPRAHFFQTGLAVGARVEILRLMLNRDGAAVAERRQRFHDGLDRHNALARLAGCMAHVDEREARLLGAPCLDVFQVEMLQPRGDPAQHDQGVQPLRRAPSRVEGEADHILVPVADPGQHLLRRFFRMVLQTVHHTEFPEDVCRGGAVAARAFDEPANDRNAEFAAQPAGGPQFGLPARHPRRVAHHAQLVPAQRRLRQRDMFGRNPREMEVRRPEVDGPETKGLDLGQHGVEALRERGQRPEMVLGGLVAGAPSVGEMIADLTGHKIGGHERNEL